MATFTIYTTTTCPYCVAAKNKLVELGHTYLELNIADGTNLADMKSRTNAKTVPQIFIGNYQIGGYTDMLETIRNGSFSIIVDMNNKET